MTQFFSMISILFGLTYLSWADQQLEDKLRYISLRDNVNVVVSTLNTRADFVPVEGSDYRKIDNDLAPYKVSRISPAFLSKDGRFVLTFVKGQEGGLKRVIFIQGMNAPVADDVISMDQKSIQTSKGYIASTVEIFDSAKAARAKFGN